MTMAWRSKRYLPLLAVAVCGLLFQVNQAFCRDEVIREEFADLSEWKEFLFKGIEKKTKYEIVEEGGDRVLKASSKASRPLL